MVVLGGGAVSYERGTPAGLSVGLAAAEGCETSLRTTASQKRAAVPRRARIPGA